METFLGQFVVADINSKDVIERYAEIAIFSQGKLSTRPLGKSARNMGKNDLWIAATASVTNAKLLTMDKDFNHLDGVYLDLELITLVR
jgi:predicted nucleic acid-binding protein